jgi:chemotaxis protein MotA
MDIATILGLIVGFGAILVGQVLEGGHISSLIQPTAALIVLGGTAGATLVSFNPKAIIQAFRDARKVFFAPDHSFDKIITEICGYASQARKNGLISLEKEAKGIKDDFTRKGIGFIVDGMEPQKFKDTMEVEIAVTEEHSKMSFEVFEAAGGYAPTIGIIGAVLGLIHVMENLSDASKLGAGIAVAFVATIYGLMTANIICLPIGTKLKHYVKMETLRKELILEGLIGVLNGESTHYIERRLKAFLTEHKEEKG